MQIWLAKELIVYRKANGLAMEVFKITRRFPVEERYPLADQVRRSSRSVCLISAVRRRSFGIRFLSPALCPLTADP
jgi:hypothetical protein